MSETVTVQHAFEALRDGDTGAARRIFLDVTASGQTVQKEVWYGLALAALREKEPEEAIDAIDRYLVADPRNIRANILKGDALYALGRLRPATTFYSGAVSIARSLASIPAELKPELDRASATAEEAFSRFEAQFNAALAKTGYESWPDTDRAKMAVEILSGRRKSFPQNPTHFFFPGLAVFEYFEPSWFPWLGDVAASWEVIRDEFVGASRDGDMFEPYLRNSPIAPALAKTDLFESYRWSAIHLFKEGERMDSAIARFPRTMEILSRAPIPHIPGKSPNVVFSRLRAGAHLEAHHGQTNVRLLCHLPLIAPEGCGMRVGGTTKSIEAGHPLVFDDSIEHEAWNRSAEDRVTLIFDIWRPELSQEEQERVLSIFEAVAQIG